MNTMYFFRLSPEIEVALVLFFFLFPAIWGAALMVAAAFIDLEQLLGRAGPTRRKISKVS